MKQKTIVINLYGAPGSGKSTGAAYIFSQLKLRGINCELVTEFVKDKVWEESKGVFNDQLYILGKQHFRLSRLLNKVDVIVTDSPIFNSVIYSEDYNLKPYLSKIVKLIESTEYLPLNYIVTRVKSYNPIGRFQTEEQANRLASDINISLLENQILFNTINGDIDGYESIIKTVIETIDIYE